MGVTRIGDFLKIFIDIGIIEKIPNNFSNGSDIENDIINKILSESFIEEIDSSLQNDRQRKIIHQRFGLDDDSPKTLDEVADYHQVTRERVRQIEAKCLRLLRKPTKNFKKYM